MLVTEAAGGLARCDGERLPTGDEWTWLLAVNEDADALAWRTLAEPAADGDRRLHHLRDGVIEWTFDPGHQVRLGDWGDESAYLQTRATEGATLRGRASGEDWVVDPTVDRWAGDLERPWAGAHLVRSLGPGPAACRKTRRVQLEPLVDAGTWCLPANEVPTGWFLVPPGRYTMPDLRPDGMPMTRTVELAEGLLVADAEVSIAVWEGTDFSEAAPMTMWGAHFPFEDPLLPAIGYLVDQLTYVNQLSRREDLPQCYQFIPCPAQTSGFGCASIDTSGPGCLGYRLPTEDEWRAIAAFLVARNPGTSPAEGAQLLRTHPDVYFRRAGVPGAVLFDVFGNVSEALWPIDPETRALVPVISDNPAAPDLVQNFKRPPANRALPGVDDLFELRPCSTHLFADVKCLQGLRPVRSVMCHGPPRPDIP